MECLPGGLCVFLEHNIKSETHVSDRHYYKIYHATEGLVGMADYYFISLDEAREHGYNIGNV